MTKKGYHGKRNMRPVQALNCLPWEDGIKEKKSIFLKGYNGYYRITARAQSLEFRFTQYDCN
jgi:hypothetical protein